MTNYAKVYPHNYDPEKQREKRRKEEEELCKIIKQTMENVVGLEVPLLVEIGKGKTWLEAH